MKKERHSYYYFAIDLKDKDYIPFLNRLEDFASGRYRILSIMDRKDYIKVTVRVVIS